MGVLKLLIRLSAIHSITKQTSPSYSPLPTTPGLIYKTCAACRVHTMTKIIDGREAMSATFDNLLKLTVDSSTIMEYMEDLKTRSIAYQESAGIWVCKMSIYCQKKFNDIERKDILRFLNKFLKPESIDPLHKSIGTYNLGLIHMKQFFRWFYGRAPGIPVARKKFYPDIIKDLEPIRRREESIYKPDDIWTLEDDMLFLKYCPNPRDRCFFSMSRDVGTRPHEILKLKIKDMMFKRGQNNTQYAEIMVNGKTGNRSLPLYHSLPYIKDWIKQHPQGANRQAILICSDRRKRMHITSIGKIFRVYKNEYFPALLRDPNVPEDDKQKIRELLLKPWNPYMRRHTALTEKSRILNENQLRHYAGWSKDSEMPRKYLHYFANESSNTLLKTYGIITEDEKIEDLLKPLTCTNCSEPNKINSSICTGCGFILKFSAYEEMKEEQVKKDARVQLLMKEQESSRRTISELETKIIDIHRAAYVHTKEQESKEQEKDKEIESLKEQMEGIFRVLEKVKINNGIVGDMTMLDEKRRVTIHHVGDNNKIMKVKIPIDDVEVSAIS